MGRLTLWLFAATALCAQGPPGVSFAVSTPESRTVFKLGEVIPLTLRLSASPNRWRADTRMQDRIGRLNDSDEFRVEPAGGVRDPLEGSPRQHGGMGGIWGPPVVLGPEPFEYDRDLNEWVRFRKPGVYRLKVMTRRVSRLPDGYDPQGRDRYLYPRSEEEVVELTSNEVTLEIVEASAEWAAAELRKAVALLDDPEYLRDDAAGVRKGARMLRFLGTPEAVREMVRRVSSGPPTPTHVLQFGILAAGEEAGALAYMEERLRAPDQDREGQSLSAPVSWCGLRLGGLVSRAEARGGPSGGRPPLAKFPLFLTESGHSTSRTAWHRFLVGA